MESPILIDDTATELDALEIHESPALERHSGSNIVLASSSPYRQALLARLLDQFICDAPEIDEQRKPDEPLKELALRLAIEKATKMKDRYPQHLIIGSDQVACLTIAREDIQLSKPYTRERCFEQLTMCQGNTVHFYTGLCLLNSQTGGIQSCIDHYETRFRRLNAKQIWNYIEKEPALDCAGGFKMEGLGIALFEYIRGDDPNTLIGLPLIRLAGMLHNEGIDVF
jgi:septum formation protein